MPDTPKGAALPLNLEGARVGALFAGYDGIGLALAARGAHPAWFSEVMPAANRVLAHHWPEVPNLGDVTAADWASAPPVDVLTGGFPCQDVSLAGRRAGMRDGTRSGLWASFADAIDVMRPELVVIENVRGLLSAGAGDGDMEQCPWCVGDTANEHHLRALGAVVGDLARMGYDARWGGIRAADAGAPHGRFRVFITARPVALTSGVGYQRGRGYNHPRLTAATGHRPTIGDPDGGRLEGHPARGAEPSPGVQSHRPISVADSDGPGLPTGAQRTTEPAGWGDANGPRGDIGGPRPLLKTPTANLATNGGSQHPDKRRAGDHRPTLADETEHLDGWGPYAAAIGRWQGVTGRPAPTPTLPSGRGGAHRLNPVFVEWMMGLPPGHVTDPTMGLSRADHLTLLGNGVVPQQAALALHMMGI